MELETNAVPNQGENSTSWNKQSSISYQSPKKLKSSNRSDYSFDLVGYTIFKKEVLYKSERLKMEKQNDRSIVINDPTLGQLTFESELSPCTYCAVSVADIFVCCHNKNKIEDIYNPDLLFDVRYIYIQL